MPACASCGAENREGARFCDACGAPLGSPGPERRKLATLLFCDVSGSTAMGERLDAESVRELMFRYFHEMRLAVERHGGTVEKFVGDAVLAVFGVPLAHEDDALRAVRAAAEMRDRLAELNEELEVRFGSQLALRIGVNTGEVVAGDVASRETFVTGDAVNTAARLEQAARPGEILLGDLTYELTRQVAVAEATAPIAAKGKAERVAAYRLVDVAAGPVRRRTETPLVGRRDELAHLEALFEQAAREKRCVIATVVGEPGVGKSRLCRELATRLAERATVYTGRCLSYGEGITYWPLAEIVRQAASIRDEHSPDHARARIAALVVPEIAGPICALIGLGGETTAEDVPWAVRGLFEGLARGRPLLCQVEDVHWAETAMLDLLERLAEGAQAPILLLCTARPELVDARPDWPALRLEPLAEDEVGELLESFGLDEAVRSRVVSSARGNPLFAEELAAYLRQEPAASEIPATLSALLAARLDLLPDSERASAERGAIEGELFHRGAVEALGGSLESLPALTERDLIRPAEAQFVDEAAFRFKHILVRDAAYNGLAKKFRAELHERFAGWLEEKAQVRASEYEEILGHHLERAYRYREELGPIDERAEAIGAMAAERLASAGRRAYLRGDIAAAASLLTRAESLWPADALPRLAVLPDLGAALALSGELVRADEVLTEAIDRATDVARPIQARALIERTLLRDQMNSDPEPFTGVAASTIPVLEEVGDHAGLAKAWKLLAFRQLHDEFRHEAALQKLERALDHARLARDAQEQGELQIWIGAAIVRGPTPVKDGIVRTRTVLARASGRTEIATGTTVLAVLEAMHGRFDQARDLATQAKEIYAELGLELWVAAMANAWGPIELLAGDPGAAERELRQGYEGLVRFGEKTYLSTVAGWLSRALCEQGRDEDAERFADICADAAPQDDLISQVLSRTTHAKVLVRRGEIDEGERLVRETIELLEPTDAVEYQANTLVDLAEVLAFVGRSEDAAPCLERALRLYEQKGVIPSITKTRGLLQRMGRLQVET